MRVRITSNRMASILRWTQRVLFVGAFAILGYCVFVMTESWIFQRRANRDLEGWLQQSQSGVMAPASRVKRGELIGRVDVPRLGVSVAVVEGDDAGDLRHAAGHIGGTAFPGEIGNVGIAAHRDTFFRPLRNIRTNDVIQVTTQRGDFRYRVISTKIVDPDDVAVLRPDGNQVLTLVTCYPFYYIGSAPDRFIVRAERVSGSVGTPHASALQPGAGQPHL